MFGKSTTPTLNIQFVIGDVVFVRDEHLTPTKLHLTQVVDIHPWWDGQVRLLVLRISQVIYLHVQASWD